MNAQNCYDDRDTTAFCSGDDLHEFFNKELGYPSPDGRDKIDQARWADFVEKKTSDMSVSPSAIEQMRNELPNHKIHPDTRRGIERGLARAEVVGAK